jgi:hypothetical protein
MRPETSEKAFATGKKAIELEPGNLRYALNFGYTLINLGKLSEAKYLADRIQAASKTPQENQMADSLRQAATARASMGQYAEIRPQTGTPPAAAKSATGISPDSSESAASSTAASPGASSPRSLSSPDYLLEGKIIAVDCKPGGEVIVTVVINTVLLKFHAADWKSVEVTPETKALTGATPACSSWKAQNVQVVFRGKPAGKIDGELVAIHFR